MVGRQPCRLLHRSARTGRNEGNAAFLPRAFAPTATRLEFRPFVAQSRHLPASPLIGRLRAKADIEQAALSSLNFTSARLIRVCGPKGLLIPVLVALLADLSRLLTLLGRHWFLAMLLRAIALLPLGLLQFLFFLPVHWLLLRACRPSMSAIGTFRTWRGARCSVAIGGKADLARLGQNRRE
jgi:hypothetical protein